MCLFGRSAGVQDIAAGVEQQERLWPVAARLPPLLLPQPSCDRRVILYTNRRIEPAEFMHGSRQQGDVKTTSRRCSFSPASLLRLLPAIRAPEAKHFSADGAGDSGGEMEPLDTFLLAFHRMPIYIHGCVHSRVELLSSQ